ncbi:uncharacterized protein PGTG_03076 [Puccinia graminis f. sp. tritici CRL 75-36-700-3]|uniref:DNA 3'-5' helicase n=1 Tax=Puccinia graminis f. sp. tritici (strain CRL 75-36-700-3 / race SCCL) TaxID=418459 RepID=E3JYJ5_PUCGT|nr:uncharacterized protein PGTG_03076 [Puccinia graminis f. sp. tritici CRL 75-36-700-3]EFP77120.1 hypothetical protein PGTG_03076 [Puccinia graminis f. sp. tritici CRL 75-36-700-3]
MTFNRESIGKIKQGKFSFVYLSPEVFLNSLLFTELFSSDAFQAILALIVVDEAHMVYLWGLVASKQSKTLIIFACLEDQAIFWPAYGHIGTRLMATDNIPLLLLFATCRPEAVSAITTSLMLQPSELSMIDERAIGNFDQVALPVISATMALGLVQNLKRVRCVIQMGQGDPEAIVQMVGCCGRDGNVGLGLLFMERMRKNGKNNLSDFPIGAYQDALAVTQCCLRIALTLDNK